MMNLKKQRTCHLGNCVAFVRTLLHVASSNFGMLFLCVGGTERNGESSNLKF